MTAPSKPIPALYTVYILRSTMRHASLYVGSTTDPPRRLKQHNGEIRGGAVRTSRASLRPWNMVALVSGFPGAVAALKFEWALTNPHLSLHIPSESRLIVSKQKKKNGHPKRPVQSMQSMLANLHLLLRVPSFARWPLRLHIFAPEVHAAWQAWCKTANQRIPDTLELVTDFGPVATAGYGGESSMPMEAPAAAPAAAPAPAPSAEVAPPWGIHTLPLDYTHMRDYVDKANDIFTFEREGDCVVCKTAMPPGQGLYAVCPNATCEAVGHLRCWSQHVLSSETGAGHGPHDGSGDSAAILPMRGNCPKCGGAVLWSDMMKELTLRLRAPKEVEKLAKAKRRLEKAEKAQEAAADKAAKKQATEAAAVAAAAEVANMANENSTTAGQSEKGAAKRGRPGTRISPKTTTAKSKAALRKMPTPTRKATSKMLETPRKKTTRATSPNIIVLS